ncbi:MAG: peptide ABC transporter substrate-binding protein [Rhodospirillales bacterium]
MTILLHRIWPVLALVLALFGNAAPARSGDLVIGITQYPTTLHPLINAMMSKSYTHAMTRRPLMTFDPDWNLTCLLCTEIPTFENGRAEREKTPTGQTGVALTFTLHPDAVWADDVPVSSQDVVFTWEVGKHPQSGVAAGETYNQILAIDVVDEKTFVMHIDRLAFDYNDFAGFDILPDHVERSIFEADPANYKSRTAFDTDSLNPGLYHGPYVIAEKVSGSHIALERNPLWWGDAPAFDRIVVRAVENTSALEANLLSGSIDMIAGEVGMNIDQALAFSKRFGNRFNVVHRSGLVYEHIDLNLDNPILADVRVRRALVHAIDREAISMQLFAGRQPVAASNVNPLDSMHDGALQTLEYDVRKAEALLAEAGWDRLRDGVRVNAAGDRLSLEFMTTAGNRTRELVQQVLQSQWARVGIEVRIVNEPARVFFGKTLTERLFTGLAMFAWISAPESLPRTTLHSSHIPDPSNGFGGQNFTGFRNAEVDRLIDEIELELDRDRRRALWSRMQEIYIDQVPVIPLYFRANSYILPPWLDGVTPTGHQFPSTLWVEHWRDNR